MWCGVVPGSQNVIIKTLADRTPEYRWRGQTEIFENLAFMYGQNFKKKFPQSVRTAAGINPKSLNLFGLSIRPQKTQNLFGRGHQFPIFVLTGLKNGSQQ
jgi:hypothetical protein